MLGHGKYDRDDGAGRRRLDTDSALPFIYPQPYVLEPVALGDGPGVEAFAIIGDLHAEMAGLEDQANAYVQGMRMFVNIVQDLLEGKEVLERRHAELIELRHVLRETAHFFEIVHLAL